MKLSYITFCARRRQGGWALLAVLTLTLAGLMILASVMNWASENSTTTARNNEYFATSYAAEAATEKVLSAMSQQYQSYGFSLIGQNMSTYESTVPIASDNSYWTNYHFSGGTTPNTVIVTNIATATTIVMGAPYTGLTMVANTYEIIANAQNMNTEYEIVSTVGQQINLGTIPLFQFAIFYQNDMEICPGAAMTIGGVVHGNANIYMQPQDGLTFLTNVSAVGSNVLGKSPLDPTGRTPTAVTFDGYDLSGVDPLNLPVGATNVYSILLPAQAGQTPSSSVGTNLLYNKADMIIVVSNNNAIIVTSGADINNQATTISNSQWAAWLSTNGAFYDQRDSLNVNPVVLNVSNLVNWSATNTVLRPVLSSLRGSSAADVESIYIVDERSTSNGTITTNYVTGTNYTTNTQTTSTYPSAGSYIPPVTSTNTAGITTGSYPSAGTYIGNVSTNTNSTTTASYPSAGTYLGSVTTDTQGTTTSSKPASGTYVGSITNNSHPTSYSYAKITGYTYEEITGYSYSNITGYTYNYLTATPYTNATYLTNWTIITQPGIVLSNGAVLPPNGLSIATPDPAYIDGNWNIQLTSSGTSDAGSANVSYTRPSAIYADAITVLSPSWNPANSSLSISSRNASSDTVNAAFLTGNVPSNGTYYSGGVENFPRFLENWSGQTFTYNGSMVAMFASQIATAPWPGTGSVYNPPTRNWTFDTNFNNPALQPPMTPQVISVQRAQWTLLKPYATSF